MLIALWLGRFLSSLIAQRAPEPTFPVRWMLSSDVVRMGAQLGLLLWIVATGNIALVPMIVSAFAYGCATAFFNPARFGLISALFTERERVRVNGYLSMIGDVLFVLGPLVGTALVLTLGFRWVLALDAFSFALAMLLVLPFLKVRAQTSESSEGASSEQARSQELDSQEPHTGEAAHSPKKAAAVTLPTWVHTGLATWFVSALATGFLGTAGPTWVMSRFSEASWGVMAAGLAVGSLAGSAAVITTRLSGFRWNRLQMIALVAVAAQILALVWSPVLAVAVVFGALGAGLNTVSGISWDVVGQSFQHSAMVHQFATRDQLVATTGIPLGMVLFSITASMSHGAGVGLALLLLAAAAVCVVPSLWHGLAKDQTSAQSER